MIIALLNSWFAGVRITIECAFLMQFVSYLCVGFVLPLAASKAVSTINVLV